MIFDRTIRVTVAFRCDGCYESGKRERWVAPELVETAKVDFMRHELRAAEDVEHGNTDWRAYGSKHFCGKCAQVLVAAGVIPKRERAEEKPDE
jgi:hypothetical protein